MIRTKSSPRLKNLLTLPSKATILCGILETAQHDDAGMTVASLGAIHEFGLGVPERSFIRAWYDNSKSEIEAILAAVHDEQGLQIAALQLEASMKNWVNAGVPPPNAPATVARKGSSLPLVDTGILRAAIVATVKVT